jgi:Fic family protein
MIKQDKKLAVFTAIHYMKDWVSLSELLGYLGEGYAERSVRRWLNELIKQGSVEKKGQKRGTLYRANPAAVGVRKELHRLLFAEQYKELIAYIRQPLYLRKYRAYQKQWLEDYIPNKTFYLSNEERFILREWGERSNNHDAAGTYAKHIYNRLLIDLSYNSSRLEGNTYSLLDTEKLIIEGESASGKLNEEKIMILNHKEAIRYLIDNAEKITINFETICTLHYLLADGLLPSGRAGILRDHAVKIGGSTYLPVDNKLQLEHLLTTISAKAAFINDPYEQSFFLLVHIAYLQAFEDVNKRTSRLSANIPLIKNNLVPLSFNDISKEDYHDAMIIVYELNDIKPLASLYYYSYRLTCQEYDSSVESLGFDRIKIIYREARREILKNIIVLQLTGTAIQDYVEKETQRLIPAIDQAEFIKTINEEISVLAPGQIAGFGVTKEQLIAWQELQKK